jgi:hypothetical protein
MWLFWLTPVQTNEGDAWRIVLALALMAAALMLVASATRPSTPWRRA